MPGHLRLTDIAVAYADGETFLSDVDASVSAGERAVLVGPNGSGKTSLLRVISGELPPIEGDCVAQGGLAVMPQFIGGIRDDSTVRDLCVSLSGPAVRTAAASVDACELELMERDDEDIQLRYASALAAWGDAGGYEAELHWDKAASAALGHPYDVVKYRGLASLSGGEQKRLALELLLTGPEQVLLLDEPDNYLDVPGKEWLEHRLRESKKAILLVSHDRRLLANVSTKVIAIEAGTVWVHGGSFSGWDDVRAARVERLEELHRRWDDEHRRLQQAVHRLREQAKISEAMAARYRAMRTRLEKFEAHGRPAALPRTQRVRSRLTGSRTGLRALQCHSLSIHGLVHPFDLELFYGDRVAVLGPNGSGKSHFLRLLSGEDIPHDGQVQWGARVRPGLFVQTHQKPAWIGQRTRHIAETGGDIAGGRDRSSAMGLLSRYELAHAGDTRYEDLSGGQQARLQLALLEAAEHNALLLDEPTDNLDLVSAEALQSAIVDFHGVVLAVTHDRWFVDSFTRYLIFGSDGRVNEATEPVWSARGS